MNDLYRLVTEQDDRAHVSSVLLTSEEAWEGLVAEMLMHVLTDWVVSPRLGSTLEETAIVCARGETVRVLSVVSAHPMEELHGAI